MKPKATNIWLKKPEAHDYPASYSYLSLLFDNKTAENLVKRLKRAPVVSFKAKDIFRASGSALLGVSNTHVQKNHKKIAANVPLSPLLLVRNLKNQRVIIADGYHRLCAVYTFSEDVSIPCKIV